MDRALALLQRSNVFGDDRSPAVIGRRGENFSGAVLFIRTESGLHGANVIRALSCLA